MLKHCQNYKQSPPGTDRIVKPTRTYSYSRNRTSVASLMLSTYRQDILLSFDDSSSWHISAKPDTQDFIELQSPNGGQSWITNNPDRSQNLNAFSLTNARFLHEISTRFVHNLMSNLTEKNDWPKT